MGDHHTRRLLRVSESTISHSLVPVVIGRSLTVVTGHQNLQVCPLHLPRVIALPSDWLWRSDSQWLHKNNGIQLNPLRLEAELKIVGKSLCGWWFTACVKTRIKIWGTQLQVSKAGSKQRIVLLQRGWRMIHTPSNAEPSNVECYAEYDLTTYLTPKL